jgi:hypothetical protein
VGPPGAAKTELIRALVSSRTFSLSTLTDKTLISGLKTPRGDEDPSLLPKLDGKVLVIKDFTGILSGRHEVRTEIFGQLRDIYDGYYEKAFGSSVGTRRYQSRVGIVAGVTPEIDRYGSVDQALGERFLKIRINYQNPDEAVRRSRRNAGEQDTMRKEIVGKVRPFLEQPWPRGGRAVYVAPQLEEKIVQLASTIALLRTAVPKNHKGELAYVPVPEVGTRLAVQFSKLGNALALVRGKGALGEEEYRALLRVAQHSLPSLRYRIVYALGDVCGDAFWRKSSEIARTAALPDGTVTSQLRDMKVIGAVDRKGSRPHVLWRPTRRLLELLKSTELVEVSEP